MLRDDARVRPTEFSAREPTDTFTGLRGHFALRFDGNDGGHLLVRDQLGVNKLFFALGPQGQLDTSNYFIDLVRRGHRAQDIWSVPSGHVVRVRPQQRELSLEKYSNLHFADEEPAVDSELPVYAARIRARLDATFRTLRTVLAGRPIYVTLSGGLDSTTVAALAREHIGDVVGVTFVVRGSGAEDDEGSDVFYAKKVAQALGMRLQLVEVAPEALLDVLDEVLVYGQDFRDFNVHCGLVNAALAAAIARFDRPSDAGRPVVLTGDTMNELMADYTPVAYEQSEYYSLPRLPVRRLRRFLVTGLDTGDREVGIFAHHGIDTVQPYALIPEVYTSLPGAFLEAEGAKQRLARLVMGDAIPSFIYDRPKVRAQVGGSKKVGGTLAALVDQGIDQAELFNRFARLCSIDAKELKRWIRAGVYRFTASYPGGA